MSSRRSKHRQPNRQATRRGPAPRRHPTPSDPTEQELVQTIRAALRAENPFALAELTSILVEVMERGGDTLPTEGRPANDIVESFLEIPLAETTAMLSCLAAMLPDELLAARARNAAASRRHPLPEHVARVADIRATRASVLEVLDGGSENLIIELDWPGIHDATLVIYVDHILGSIAKDGFLAHESYPNLLARMRELSQQQGLMMQIDDLDLADARARIDDAVARDDDAIEAPPTDTWPGMRAFVEMVARGMPEGGTGYEDRWEYDGDEGDDDWLAHDFLASDEYLDIGDYLIHDHELAHALSTVAVFTHDDPLRWDAESVQRALTQMLPVMLSGDPEEYERAPLLLRAMIRYSHREATVTAETTLETLAAVDRWQGDYLAQRDDPDIVERRLALRTEMLANAWPDPTAALHEYLVETLGSDDAVASFDAAPLPDEALDLADVPDDIHDKVRAIAELTDRVSRELFDVEVRTACRRMLAMVARRDPAVFRRRSKDETAAAAVVWIVAHVNRQLKHAGKGVSVGSLMESLGLRGSPSQRAEVFINALGSARRWHDGEITLGTPDLLTSKSRAELLELRDETPEPPSLAR